MRACPYCGTSVPEVARFCPECGKMLPVQNHEEEQNRSASYDFLDDDSYRDDSSDDDSYSDDIYGDDIRRNASEEEEFASQNRKTMMLGIIMAALICTVGIGLYFVVSNMLKQEPEIEVGSGLGSKPVQVETKPVQTEKPEEDISEGIPSIKEEEEEEPEEITATVLESGQVQINGYMQAAFVGCQESSVLEDGGVYHVSQHMIDGRADTSWQEGADGDGIGEWVMFQLDREHSVKYLTFMMGNWKSDQLFYANNRPESVLLKLDDQEFYLTFPDGMREYTVELSEECQASSIFVQVMSVYRGASWDDCCITDMSVYGR